jgi:hypothetical protein
VFVFEELNRIAGRKDCGEELKALVLKKALVDRQGVRFMDGDRI